MATTKALGTTLSFTPAGGAACQVGRLSSIGELSPDSEELDVTTLDSAGGCREYIQGFKDPGELEVSGFHDAGNAGQRALRAAYASGQAGSVEIAFPDGVKASFTAYVKQHTLGAAEVDGAVGFGAVFRITGPVAVSEAQGGES